MSFETFPVRLEGEWVRHDDCGGVFEYARHSEKVGLQGWKHKHVCLKCKLVDWLPHKYPRIYVMDASDHGFASLDPIAAIDAVTL